MYKQSFIYKVLDLLVVLLVGLGMGVIMTIAFMISNIFGIIVFVLFIIGYILSLVKSWN